MCVIILIELRQGDTITLTCQRRKRYVKRGTLHDVDASYYIVF